METGQGDTVWRRGFDPESLIGFVLSGKYKITRYLGRGGFGVVYEGRNINLPGYRLVIKFLKPASSEGMKERFVRESEILCQLEHPHICRILDYLPADNALIIQYIDGSNCENLLTNDGPLDEPTLLAVARGLCDAVEYAHSKGIAHRDVKPSNIMIDQNGHVWLIDFGIAKEVDATSLTDTGRPPYTPQYAAPERHTDRKYDPFLSDIYETGATICKLGTGLFPIEALYRQNRRRGRLPKGHTLSWRLTRILRKATSTLPEDRYKSMAGMAAAIRNVRYAYRRIKPVYAILLILALIAFGIYWHPWVPGTRELKIADGSDTTHTNSLGVPDSGVHKPITTDTGKDSTSGAGTTLKPLPIKPVNPPKEETPVTPAIETKKEPPPPTTASLTIGVDQQDNTDLYVGLKPKSIGKPMSLPFGEYAIRIVNPDYPIFQQTLSVYADINRKVDLAAESASGRKVSLLIGGMPSDLEGKSLRVSVNGRPRTYESLPVSDIELITGLWNIEFSLIGSSCTVDSFVVFPGDPGITEKVPGGKSDIDLANPKWRRYSDIEILIYWTGEKKG